ncbi:MAG: hypothetical protein ABIS50_18135 [Luteolibacter sp.]|uniref:hypothetical protein n=1 Tax=Luteolibacter sp. TaxID=1962973 RepID=UPI003263B04C
MNNLDVTGLENKNFAIVWFDGILTSGAPANAPIGTKYGIVQGTDWTLPAVDINGTYVFSLTDSSGPNSYYRADLDSSTTTGINFKTATGLTDSAALFTVVPEPSCVFLCVLGLLPLARQRR